MSLSKRFSSKWVSVLLIFAVIWMVRESVGLFVRVRSLTDEFDSVQDRVTELERDIALKEDLFEQIQDPSWLAYQARLRLNYKLPDEQVVVVYKKEKSDIISPAASTSVQPNISFWHSLWKRLRGAK